MVQADSYRVIDASLICTACDETLGNNCVFVLVFAVIIIVVGYGYLTYHWPRW